MQGHNQIFLIATFLATIIICKYTTWSVSTPRPGCLYASLLRDRYLLAVNVMTASVLRGLVETALSDIHAFFRIYTEAPTTSTPTASPQTESTKPCEREDVSDRRACHGRVDVGDVRRSPTPGGDRREEGDREQAKDNKRNKTESVAADSAFSCPPAFKVRTVQYTSK